MTVPVLYRKSNESTLANYNYSEISEGTGVIKFYGFSTQTDSTKAYALSQNPVYSSDVETSFSVPNGANFDLSAFNLPKTIGGTGIVNACFYVGSGTGYLGVILKRVRNGVETNIVTGVYSPNKAAVGNLLITVPLTIPQTSFKRGDILRLRLEATGASCVIAHDPQNRDGTYNKPSTDKLISKMEFYCPFKLDL
jgi:hypothetical protein